MKPLPSSKKLTLWGNAMKLEKAFQKLRETDHSDSFEGLDSWLDQNTKKKRPMKSIYKIAASFTLIAVIFIACSVPVEQNQEIGYMIKGVSSLNQPDIKSKMMSATSEKWPINSKRSFTFSYIEKGSNYLIKEFPDEKNYEDAKDKVQEL